MSVIPINRVKKEYNTGAYRAFDSQKTLEKIRPIMQEIGVACVDDITDSDRLGIPVFFALRPNARWGATKVNGGKGICATDAEVSAMMTAIERFSAEYHGENMEFTSYEQIGLTKAIDPASLILPRELQVGEQMHWVPSWDLLGDTEIYVPANAIYHPYDPLGMAQQLFRSDTNGLGAGNVPEEAILHAMYEVIERDALSCAEKNRSLGRRLIVDKEGPALEMLKKFEDNGIQIHLWYIDGKTGVHTIAAAADDTLTKDPKMLVTGSGSNLSAEIALIDALTEVAQRRALSIKGEGENKNRQVIVEKAGYDRLKRINRIWFAEDADEIKLTDIPDRSTEYIDEDIKLILKELESHTEYVLVFPLTKTEIPVVRVVIPGFEVSYLDSARRKK